MKKQSKSLKRRLKSLADIIIKPNDVIPFFSEGNWSLYQLLSHCLAYSGKAKIKISSFSLSENAIRSFINDRDNGLIEDMVMLFDISIPKRKFDMMLFAHEVISEVRLAPNHSKVVLISGDIMDIAIISSHNLTPNPRIEAGCIFTLPEIFAYYNDMFDQFFNKALPFNAFGDE